MENAQTAAKSIIKVSTNNQKFVCMNAGDGRDSYARNSHPQGAFIQKILPTIEEVIDGMKFSEGGVRVVNVADLGCSSGPNTIFTMKAIIERLKMKFTENEMPEFLAYFQDLAGTDFNTLFRLLTEVDKREDVVPFFACGVPGSFYGRLFPASSLNFVVSSFALHWLSQIPEEVLEEKSPAYNGGHTELHLSSFATIEAYGRQAREDLTSFLACRAVEMAEGASMMLIFGLREDYFPYKAGFAFELQETVWEDLVCEGLVEAHLRDTHNNYVYYRTKEEVDAVLSHFDSVFHVERRDEHPSPLSSSFESKPAPDLAEMVNRIISVFRGAGGNLLEGHFGKVGTDLFLNRYRDALIDRFNSESLLADLRNVRQHLVLVLKRK